MTKKATGKGRKPGPKPEADPTKPTPKKRWMRKFVDQLRLEPNVTNAAIAAGVNRQYVYDVRNEDQDFAREWDEALAVSVDKAEAELFRRAVEGVSKPVYQGGQLVGEIQEYADTLLIFLLKSHRPERYRERSENFNIDVSMLNDEAVDRLAKGESLYSILANSRAGRAGTPPPASKQSG